MMTNASEILDRFPQLLTWVQGAKNQPLKRISAPEDAEKEDLVFVHGERFLEMALQSNGSTFVLPEKCISQAQKWSSSDVTLLSTPLLQLAKASVAKTFFPIPFERHLFHKERIHPTAHISSQVEISPTAVVGPFAVIGESVTLGDNCYIGSHSVIEPNTQIGKNTHIHPHVLISHGTQIGNDCTIQSMSSIGSIGFGYAQNREGESFHIPHYGNVVLQDRVEIGANVQVDRGTLTNSIIGEGTKIDNHCHFGHNFQCGKNNLITAGFISAGSVNMGDFNVIGGRVSVAGHLTIGSHITVAAKSAITKNLTEPGAYGGYPVIPLKEFLKAQKSLAHLPEIRRYFKKKMRINRHQKS